MGVAQMEGRRIRIQGTVQGVGFRPWVYRMAHSAGVTGRVRNDSAGVTIEAFGEQDALARFVDALKNPPAAARILAFDQSAIAAEAAADFEIVASERTCDHVVSIPPDLATCPECTAEIFDPANRRFRYPFTNCTNCGPRFTIATDIPYDRPATTMAPFEMCPACRREYEDAADRRFHAQPNACPVCGPRLAFHGPDGTRLTPDDPIAAAARAISHGLIVAVKGIGGFHLACDATSEFAVRRLRERKHRDEKPLAVMVRDLAEAETLAVLSDVERALLTSAERPIVLVERSAECSLPSGLAPHNRMLGLFLPYSPLHHLLLADAGRPLVMTSANLSDEPIAFMDDEAIHRLVRIADCFLMHDRRIETRCDDSVVTVIGGEGAVLRRSRGYVPRAIRTPRPIARPVLACGGLLKNTFCLAQGHDAWVGPHIGDLENLETYDSYVQSIARMQRFLALQPEVIAYDMHPDYLSSRYAKRQPQSTKIAVQHHHAHVVSAMTEHGIDEPAIGIAYDGTGFGTDGTLWGGEIMVATPASFRRVATFRPIALVGGDRAIREPWRIALALAVDAFDGNVPGDVLALFDVDDRDRTFVGKLLAGRFPAPLARGVGRYFDGFGALFLRRPRSAFEGQIALEWTQVADPRVSRSYRFTIDTTTACPEIDVRLAFQDAVVDLARGEPVASIAAAFHNTLTEATAAAVRRIVPSVGALPIVASGGCFQNARLAESLCAALAPEHRVWLQRQVPPGDGGISLGQAVIASALCA
ncbi:MAG TPA: carbamoyltransferase HypF [Vicinamibacterales bacterium]|nr:carbamoyltransferase HypF [Vicinamibacterales bacterium]